MKNYFWIVELKNPVNMIDVLWKAEEKTIEDVATKWINENGNNYLTYSRLHNVYHKRNKKDGGIIVIRKVCSSKF